MKRSNGSLVRTSLAGLLLLMGTHSVTAQDKPEAPGKGYVKPVNAKENFSIPQPDNAVGKAISNEAELKEVLESVATKKTPPQGKKTGARMRGGDVRKQCGASGYRGVCTDMWQFDNFDFPSTFNTCGQAAAATVITYWQKSRTDAKFKKDLASFLYSNYGPNNALGMLGTSWQQVVSSVTTPYKMNWRKVSGESDLRSEINKEIPVIVMLDSERLRQRGYNYPASPVGIGAHYVVVYGYDKDFYFVSNHPGNYISRKDFLESWNTWIHGGIDGGNRGYVFWK